MHIAYYSIIYMYIVHIGICLLYIIYFIVTLIQVCDYNSIKMYNFHFAHETPKVKRKCINKYIFVCSACMLNST